MGGWREVWPYARTGYGVAAAALTALGATYLWPRKMMENYQWYRYTLFDSRVVDVLNSRRPSVGVPIQGGKIAYWAKPMSVPEISKEVGVSESRVRVRLGRLLKRGEVECDGENWKAIDQYR